MAYRIPLVTILYALLALTLLVVAVITLQGADAVLAGPRVGGQPKDWGWQ